MRRITETFKTVDAEYSVDMCVIVEVRKIHYHIVHSATFCKIGDFRNRIILWQSFATTTSNQYMYSHNQKLKPK